MNSASPAASASTSLAASAFVIAVSSCFAIGAILGKLAYLGGTNALSLLTVRTIAALLWLMMFLSVQRVSLSMPQPYRSRAYLVGLVLAVQTWGLYTAIEHMAAPLALISFYTFPMWIAIIEAITGRERLSRRKLVALALSFSGLILTLNTGDLHPTSYGLFAAFVGSIAMTGMLVLSSRLFPPGDSRARTMHTSLSANVVFILACVVTGSFTLPHTTSGWVGFVGVCISFPLALTGLFMAIERVGPSRTSFLLNFEPVAVAVMSAIVLGQALSGLQIVGAAMVIGAIVLLQWSPTART